MDTDIFGSTNKSNKDPNIKINTQFWACSHWYLLLGKRSSDYGS